MKIRRAIRRWTAGVLFGCAPRGVLTGLASVGLAVAVWLLHEPVWAAIRAHPYFAARDVIVRGAGPLLAPEDLLAWLGVDERTSVLDLSPRRVRARLEAHPLIDRATVRRDFPSHLEIEIREREPAAIAVLDGLYYLDRNGQVLKSVSAANAYDYPVVTGLPADGDPGYQTWAARRVLRLVRLCDRAGWTAGVSEVHLDRERGVVLFPRTARIPVVLGWGSWREKLARTERVLAAWDAQPDRLAGIDVRFRNQVLVTTRALPQEKPKLKTGSKKSTAGAKKPMAARGVRA